MGVPKDTTIKKPRKTTVRIPTDDNIVLGVLRATNGNMAATARRLNVTRDAISKWLAVSPLRKEGLDKIRNDYAEDLLDQAEIALMKNLKSKRSIGSNRATELVFKYMGKRRGYVPASQVENDNKQDVKITVVREDE